MTISVNNGEFQPTNVHVENNNVQLVDLAAKIGRSNEKEHKGKHTYKSPVGLHSNDLHVNFNCVTTAGTNLYFPVLIDPSIDPPITAKASLFPVTKNRSDFPITVNDFHVGTNDCESPVDTVTCTTNDCESPVDTVTCTTNDCESPKSPVAISDCESPVDTNDSDFPVTTNDCESPVDTNDSDCDSPVGTNGVTFITAIDDADDSDYSPNNDDLDSTTNGLDFVIPSIHGLFWEKYTKIQRHYTYFFLNASLYDATTGMVGDNVDSGDCNESDGSSSNTSGGANNFTQNFNGDFGDSSNMNPREEREEEESFHLGGDDTGDGLHTPTDIDDESGSLQYRVQREAGALGIPFLPDTPLPAKTLEGFDDPNRDKEINPNDITELSWRSNPSANYMYDDIFPDWFPIEPVEQAVHTKEDLQWILPYLPKHMSCESDDEYLTNLYTVSSPDVVDGQWICCQYAIAALKLPKR